MTGRAFLLVPLRREIPLLAGSFTGGSSDIVGCRSRSAASDNGGRCHVGDIK